MEKAMWKTKMKLAFAISGTEKHHTLERTDLDFSYTQNYVTKADNRIHNTMWDREWY